MKVGIAIPVYNEVTVVERCLRTVWEQTVPAGAYLALDAPTDGTAELLRAHPDWYAGMVELQQRRGWPNALNTAAALAIEDGCDAVIVMNADDYMRADAVELLTQAIDGQDWAVSYGQQVGGTDTLQVPLVDFPLSLADFAGPHCPIGVFALIRAGMWKELDGFSTSVSLPNSYGYNEDWDFWIRALKAGYDSGALVKQPLLYYVMSDKQLHKEGLSRHAEARGLLMAKHPDVFNDRQWAPCPCGCTQGE